MTRILIDNSNLIELINKHKIKTDNIYNKLIYYILTNDYGCVLKTKYVLENDLKPLLDYVRSILIKSGVFFNNNVIVDQNSNTVLSDLLLIELETRINNDERNS